MVLEEFHAWLEGFAEGIPEGEPPTMRQWNRIKDHLAEITDGERTDFGAWFHRYVTPYQDWWDNKVVIDAHGTLLCPATAKQLKPSFVSGSLSWLACWVQGGRAEFASLPKE